MLLFDFRAVGNKLLAIRKKKGMTQAEVAEAAGLSERTYADIERGTVNMRMETILRICQVLHITPNEVFTENAISEVLHQEEIFQKLEQCSSKDKRTALQLLEVFLESLK